MMPASKHGDPQLGVDIHLCIVPPSPSPVPLPTPHISVVFDPFDYVPFIGATVTVCGMKRATAGTGGLVVHIPPGFPFAPKLPAWDDELFMGSATVVADGDPFSFIAVPVLGCQIVGMPSIPRLKKKGKRMMLLPTTFNLAIPTSVVVGGPPTISLLGLAFKGAFAALGKFAKSGLFKRIRQKLFGNLSPGFLKCKILRAEPVNILSGEVSVQQEDFTLPGRIPIEWSRSYTSGSDHEGLCGHGWETPADTRLEIDPIDGIVCMRHPAVGPLFFGRLPVAIGDEAGELEMVDGALLTDHGDEYRVRTKEDRVYHFPKVLARPNQRGGLEYAIRRIADLCGNWLDFERRGGVLTAINESAGRRISIDVKNGRIREVALTLPGSGVHHTFVRYEYDEAGDLTAVFDALDHPYRFAYDDHHLARHTDRNGLSFYYEYDKDGEDWRVVHSWGDGGLYNYTFEYHDVLKERRITDSLGNVSIITLDERGLPICEIDALGGRTIYEYDEAGRTTAVVDPAGGRTEYHFDDEGNILKLVQADGATICNEYASGKLTVIVDPNGGRWQQRWDTRGLLIEQTTPLGHSSRCDYDAHGQLTTFVNPRGEQTSLVFDAVGNLIEIVDPAGRGTRFAYDEVGNVVARQTALGESSLFAYDVRGRLIAEQHSYGARMIYGYDAEDNLTQHVDTTGATTRFEHTGLGEIARRIQSDGHIVQYAYDTEERLVAVRNQRGEIYELRRDGLGRVVEEIDYWGQSRRYEYNGSGHLMASVDGRGRRTTYKCDAVGRIVEKAADPLGSGHPFVETFTYDFGGQLVEARNPHVSVSRILDGQGRLVQEEQRHATGEVFTIQNAWDESGNRVRRTSNLGNTIEYAYDAVDALAGARINGVEAMRVERNGRRQVTAEYLGHDLVRRFRYDETGLIAEQAVSRNGTMLFATQYHYDPVGNMDARRDNRYGGERFEHDPIGRVVQHTYPPGHIITYRNDPAGNRLTTRIVEPAAEERASATAALTLEQYDTWVREGDYEGRRYRFDRAGDLVLKASQTERIECQWDGDRHLVASRNNGALTRYGYDPLGRRVFKESNGIRTLFFWDGDVLAGETFPSSTTASEGEAREYVYRPGTATAWACIAGPPSDTRLYYFDHDPNGAPVHAVDRDGHVVWSVRYTAWGEVAAVIADEVDFRLRLQGQYEDRETGLSYNRYRYFDPQSGQFISQDLLGTAAGEGLYTFAVNTSGWADPLGLTCERATGHHLVDRVAGEIDAAVGRANRVLDRGMHLNTPWGRIYQNLLRNNPNHWLVPIARGNAVQQIADNLLANNHYLNAAKVLSNQGHLHGRRNVKGNLLRPDYQVPLSGGRLGIVDITTPGQGAKISKYIDPATPGNYPATNVFH
jgi:RHS repeat-associated protein